MSKNQPYGPKGLPQARLTFVPPKRDLSLLKSRKLGKNGHVCLLRFLSSPSGQRAWLFLLPLPPVGVTGFEPVTLRLSSACSNQLSYTPGKSGRSARVFQVQHFQVQHFQVNFPARRA